MEAVVPASDVIIAGLTFQLVGLLFLCVMFVHAEVESKRFWREFEALVAAATAEEAPSIDPSSC